MYEINCNHWRLTYAAASLSQSQASLVSFQILYFWSSCKSYRLWDTFPNQQFLTYIYKRAIKMNNQFLFVMLESSLIASLRVESSIKLLNFNVLFLYLVKHQKIGCFLILLMDIEINIWLKMGEITNNNLSAFSKLAIAFSFLYPLSKLLKQESYSQILMLWHCLITNLLTLFWSHISQILFRGPKQLCQVVVRHL